MGGITRDLAEADIETAQILITEIERAITAIAYNELGNLEESVTEQHVLTIRLKMLREQYPVGSNDRATIAEPPFDGELLRELLVTDVKLQAVSQLYHAVLQHSSRSASLMALLLGACRGQFQEASGPRLKYQTWSCQM
jgi:hypothetical protein